ncbi:hypothetical protein [Thermococcus sp.]|uniref:hypothetical protein n=1 Tax=Thermococcus sp. TaxID=35749 RepID=UPI00260E9DCC|nr:hypothetical protein [Thermococcus sp.]
MAVAVAMMSFLFASGGEGATGVVAAVIGVISASSAAMFGGIIVNFSNRRSIINEINEIKKEKERT